MKQSRLSECVSQAGHHLKYMLLDEIAEAEEKKYQIITEQQITTPSPDRTKVKCPVFYQCGGCDLLHIRYEKQLEQKHQDIESLYREAGFDNVVQPISQSQFPRHYRHKVVLSATTVKHKLRLGLYREHSKEVIPFTQCLIQDQKLNHILASIESILNQYKITAYDIDSNRGIMKHVMLRKSFDNKQVMVIFVTQQTLLPNHKGIISAIRNLHPEVVTVIQNIHRKKTHLVLLEEDKVLYGSGYLQDKIDDLVFRLSPRSFYQVNPMQMIHLYQKAIELAEIKSHEIVMDTYSGIGTLSLLAAKKAKKVIAIEVNKQAHNDAVYNKKMNKTNPIEFVCSDVEVFMNHYTENVDVLLMDPTRDGATEAFLHSVLKLRPKRIVYVSCEPKTQVRDIKTLQKAYTIKHIQPVDMFSQTEHVECVTLLELR